MTLNPLTREGVRGQLAPLSPSPWRKERDKIEGEGGGGGAEDEEARMVWTRLRWCDTAVTTIIMIIIMILIFTRPRVCVCVCARIIKAACVTHVRSGERKATLKPNSPLPTRHLPTDPRLGRRRGVRGTW